MNPRNFDPLWRKQSEPALLASRHRETGEIAFPPLPQASPILRHHDTVELAPQGSVYSYTVIHPHPKSGLAPYALAYVDLKGPARIFGRFREGDRPDIGDACTIVRDAELGYAFVLTGAAQ
jgi:uncharacterized OB-fold protein